MEYKFTKAYQKIESSFIREILKVANNKEYISFAGGLPNDNLFPKNEFESIFKAFSQNAPLDLYQYSQTSGLSKLINKLKKLFDLKNDLIITNGSQQALDLVCSIFLNKNDEILIEEPSYLGAKGLFKSYGAVCDSVALNEDGIDLKILEKKLQKNSYKFLYIIPNFQNPSSICYSNSTRKALAKLAIKYDLLIIEDDPYGFLNFSSKKLLKISDLAPNNCIYLGSFSKILAPSLRIGFITTNNIILEKINVSKQYKDLHTNLFSQHILYEYLNRFDIFKHIKELNKKYKENCDFFYNTLTKELKDKVECKKPKGGMFLWVKLKDGSSSQELLKKAFEKKVLFVPGNLFFEDNSQQSFIRFNFTNSNKKEIKEGIRRLKGLIK